MRQDDPEDAPHAAWLRRLTRRERPDARADQRAHTPTNLPANTPVKLGLRTSISEFLLVTRLRARNLLGRRGQVAVDVDAEQAAVMARYAHILGVTCKHWFPQDTPTTRGHQPEL